MATIAADVRRPRQRASLAYFAIGTVLTVIFVGPLMLAALRSTQPASALITAPSGWSWSDLTLNNYIDLFTQRVSESCCSHSEINFLRFVGNSFITAAGASIFTAILTTLAGYGLGRFRFRGQSLVFGALLIAMMVPFASLLTPIYLEFNALGLIDSLLGLALFYGTFAIPFGVFVMRNTFKAMPRELEEAAAVDGLSELGTLWRVLLPLALPGVATTVIFTFLSSWTEFLGAYTFLTSEEKLTLPIALLHLVQGTHDLNFGYLLAGNVISMIPCIAVYVVLQRYYIEGLASGAVHG